MSTPLASDAYKVKRRIFIAGHNGMVGSALLRQLGERSDVELITRTRQELDLSLQSEVMAFFRAEAIDEVYLAAAKVGGIHANDAYPADFIYENLMIESNVIHAAFRADVHKLLFLGSSCIYPRAAEQPMREEALLTGSLEPTNEPYAIAKIAGIKLCESYNRQYGTDYRSVMPTNLYGPGDNFHAENSHVVPALIRRIHEAWAAEEGEVLIWGTGKPLREFLHVSDMASASVHIMDLDAGIFRQITGGRLSYMNVGSGHEVSIAELASMIAEVIGFSGRIRFDTTRPDGSPRKLLDCSRLLSTGWVPRIDIRAGIEDAYRYFLSVR